MTGSSWSQWLGSDVDEAARDGRQSTHQRLLAGVCSAGFLTANFSLMTGAIWMAVNLLAELYIWLATGKDVVSGKPGSLAGRLNYVIAAVLMTANWSVSTAIYWFSGDNGLRIVAILVATGQLVHAQAFSFRSLAVLSVQAGIPALTLAILVLAFGGLNGAALASAAFGVVTTLGYIGASAYANMKAARALRAAYEEAQGIANFDDLTALANRRMFNEAFRMMVGFSERRQGRFALLLVDLDGLKRVNDSLGHDAGDALLVEVATRLRKLMRATDTLARVGGDEFAILLADVHSPADIEAFCERIVDSFAPTIEYRGLVLNSTPSIGAAIFPSDGDGQDTLYKAADLALYAAKNGGRNTWRRYSASLTM